MPNNNLPNPIPAGSVVFVPDENGGYRPGFTFKESIIPRIIGDPPSPRYTRHDLTTPVHHVTPEMFEAVRGVIGDISALVENRYHKTKDGVCVDCERHDRLLRLRDAFDHILNPPAPEPEKTVREKLEDLRQANVGVPSLTKDVSNLLADAIDRINARLDAIEKGAKS